MDFQQQLVLLGIGAVAGAVLSFVATELSAWRQRKFTKKERYSELSDEIIGETLKFVFKINDILNDLWVDKELWKDKEKKDPQEAKKYEQIMLRRFDEHIRTDFFSQLMFHSFQLKRLKNQTIWTKFEKLMSTYEQLTKLIHKGEDKQIYESLDKEYKILKKDFIEYCVRTTKL